MKCAVAPGASVTVTLAPDAEAGLPTSMPREFSADTPGYPKSVHVLLPMLLSWNAKWEWPAVSSGGRPYQTRVFAAAHATAGWLACAFAPEAADEASAAAGSKTAAAVR